MIQGMRLLVTNIERESCDDRRFSFEPVGAPRSLTNTQGMQKNGNDSNLLIVFYVQIMPDDFVMQLHRF